MKQPTYNILLIDDEPQIRKLLELILSGSGYHCVGAADAVSGMALALSLRPDLILLDIQLPDLSGIDVLTQLRSWYTHPIVMLSVLESEAQIVAALDAGANDYVVKPFRTQELLARIRTALRYAGMLQPDPVLHFEGLIIDLAAHTVKRDDNLVKCTATEFRLLATLAQHHNRVLTHQWLLRELWGPTYADQTQYLRVFIGQLRKKIEPDIDRPQYILTEAGIGYRFGKEPL